MKMTIEEVRAQGAQGFNCAQIVLVSAAEELGFNAEEARRLAAAFGSGMGCGEACGCFTGGLMALGLKYGNGTPEEKENRTLCKQKAKEYKEMIEAEYGSIVCREILGRRSNPDEGARAKKNCAEIMAFCTECLEKLL